ncbi:hypothetical protein B0H63DRAFT_483933 [Podospora didyma]|uniref:Killer toxin Kp4 domain-containing protein n=1 Tax=Podospora didyma TaxID=330526 RepID=A0AAE0KA12_9PEZI|nr:hypothetical protein B0H63DRAFT_483933 [Podospora didyma]
MSFPFFFSLPASKISQLSTVLTNSESKENSSEFTICITWRFLRLANTALGVLNNNNWTKYLRNHHQNGLRQAHPHHPRIFHCHRRRCRPELRWLYPVQLRRRDHLQAASPREHPSRCHNLCIWSPDCLRRVWLWRRGLFFQGGATGTGAHVKRLFPFIVGNSCDNCGSVPFGFPAVNDNKGVGSLTANFVSNPCFPDQDGVCH